MAFDWQRYLDQGAAAVTARVVQEIEGNNEAVAPISTAPPVRQVDVQGVVQSLPNNQAVSNGFTINKPLMYGGLGLLAFALVLKAVK